MTDKKYVVPGGMLEAAARSDVGRGWCLNDSLEAAIRWLAENPPALPIADAAYIAKNTYVVNETSIIAIVKSGIERMFLAPEPEVPDAVKDFLWGDWQRAHGVPWDINGWSPIESHNAQVIGAYNRGKADKAKESR